MRHRLAEQGLCCFIFILAVAARLANLLHWVLCHLWRAAITPGINVGSSFLAGRSDDVPLANTLWSLTALCLCNYVFGAAVVQCARLADHARPCAAKPKTSWNNIRSWHFAYIISVAYYLNLLGHLPSV
jgi:hypothetical protein